MKGVQAFRGLAVASGDTTTGVLSDRVIAGTQGQRYLVGQGVGSWRSASGDVVIETLPGRSGEYLGRALTPGELASLSQHFEGVEFGLVSHLNRNGERFYQVFSGEAGVMGKASLPFSDLSGFRLEYHTHPGGTPYASLEDMKTLAGLGQESSQVVLPNGSVFRFTQSNPNTLLPTPPVGETMVGMLRRIYNWP